MSVVERITLNRPEKRNALDRATIMEVRRRLSEARANPQARVVVLAAEGPDFCAGADLAELRRMRDASIVENLEDARMLGELFIEMRRHPLPLIAAVRGRALAGGCGLATACDIVLADETARFGYPETQIGFVPAMVAAMLRRAVGEKKAFELLTYGKLIDAAEALKLGLINAVFPKEAFEQEVDRWAAQLAARPVEAIRLTKHLVYHIEGMSFEAAVQAGALVNAIARQTPDCRAGIDRFLSKE